MSAESWADGPMGDVAHVEMGQSPPSEFVSADASRGVAFLQGNAEFTEQFPRPRLWCTRPAKMAKEGDALISVRAPVGALNRADTDYCIGRGLAAVRFTGLDPDFGYHALARFSVALQRMAQGTTFEAVGGQQLRELVLPRCSWPEQERIAEILDTADEAIRETEQVIAKLKTMKQGILRDLLTRGVNENGELRDPEQHQEQFKDSPLGRIPVEWEVMSLATCCARVVDCPHSTPRYLTEGVLVARTQHIRDGRFDSEGASRVSETEYKQRIARLEPSSGDVIFTREAPVGEAFVIPTGMRICLGQRVMLLRPEKEQLDGRYLVAQIYSGAVRRRISQLTGGTTNPHLNVSEVKSFTLPVPRFQEQIRIADLLDAFDDRFDRERYELAKLRSLKLGLMNDLLTGRVRTIRLQDEAVA